MWQIFIIIDKTVMQTFVFSFDSDTSLPEQLETLIPGRLSAVSDDCPDLIIAFLFPGSPLQFQLDALSTFFPDTLLVGATAMRQFSSDKLCDSGCLHFFWFDYPNHHAWVEVVECDEKNNLHCQKAINGLKTRQPDTSLLLVDGIRFPVHTLLEKFRHCCGENTPQIVGGLASKTLAPEHYFEDDGAWVFVGSTIYSNAALLIGLQGVDMHVQVVRGWEPASPVYTVTQAKENTLLAIDGIPAVDWYRDFFTLNGMIPEMPAASYGFPLIFDGPDPARKGIYRTMVTFDEPPGSVTFAGDIHTGDRIRLGLGNDDSLVGAAEQLDLKDAEACLLFSCVVRELVLGDAAEKEIATLSSKLENTSLSGFFTFGEIGPSTVGKLGFYNQTSILALLTERVS